MHRSELERTLNADGVGGCGGGLGGGEEGEVRPQAAVAAPGQVRPVHLAAGGLLLDAALPALEAVPALGKAVEAARVVVAHLCMHPQHHTLLCVCCTLKGPTLEMNIKNLKSDNLSGMC